MTFSSKKGFTLVELMVVLGLIALIMATMTSSISNARKRTQISKAEAEVKAIHQTILAYKDIDPNNELPMMTDRDADSGSIGFLIGDGGTAQSGGKIPALLMAQLQSGGKMMDPWNQPYKITIKSKQIDIRVSGATGAMQTGYHYPNFYRLSKEERQ